MLVICNVHFLIEDKNKYPSTCKLCDHFVVHETMSICRDVFCIDDSYVNCCSPMISDCHLKNLFFHCVPVYKCKQCGEYHVSNMQ